MPNETNILEADVTKYWLFRLEQIPFLAEYALGYLQSKGIDLQEQGSGNDTAQDVPPAP
jgi:hypothetical protein